MPQRTTSNDPPEPRRQFVHFGFFKATPEWRRGSDAQRADARHEVVELIQKWRQGEEMIVLAYSLAGLRADAEFMLWRVCYSIECLQEFYGELMATQLGSYLQMTRSFLAMTRHSQYKIAKGSTATGIHCGGAKYASIFPFGKTRNWYQMPFEERQRIVTDYIRVVEAYPRVRLHTLYSFGLDDQEFVLAYESDFLGDIVDLKMELRESENASYTNQDTPNYTCVLTSPEKALELLG